jgi:hypothetical protein
LNPVALESGGESFLLLEAIFTLKDPAMVYNLHELTFNMTQGQKPKLFKLFIQHFQGVARNRYPETLPLVQIITNLQRLVSSSSLDHPRFILMNPAFLNAKAVDRYLDVSYHGMYRSLLWDDCRIRIPARFRGETLRCTQELQLAELQSQDVRALPMISKHRFYNGAQSN